MTEFLHSDAYFGLVFFGGIVCLVLIFVSIGNYAIERDMHGRTNWRTKHAARLCLAAILGGPVAVVCWPLIIPAAIVYGFSQIARDAIGSPKR